MVEIEQLYKLSEENPWFKPKNIAMYRDFVFRAAQESTAVRRKVGALTLTNHGSVFIGYNGTEPGEDNCCETVDFTTKPSVIHAEKNALNKMLNENIDPKGTILFVTDSPCMTCSEDIIIKYGISAVIYFREYRDTSPIDRLCEMGVKVFYLTENDLEIIRVDYIEKGR